MTLLFIFVSVSMMDRHILEKKPAYTGTMKKVSALVPWFPQELDQNQAPSVIASPSLNDSVS